MLNSPAPARETASPRNAIATRGPGAVAMNADQDLRSRGYALGYSVGVAAFEPGTAQSIEALIATADASMYAHKRGKRAA